MSYWTILIIKFVSQMYWYFLWLENCPYFSLNSNYSVIESFLAVKRIPKFWNWPSYNAWRMNQLKFKLFRKNFWCPWILPKYEGTNSFFLLWRICSFLFWEYSRTPKSPFQIIWPLTIMKDVNSITPPWTILV